MTRKFFIVAVMGLLTSLTVCLPYFFMGDYLKSPASQFSVHGPGIVKIDELNYAARIREVYDGNLIPTDTQVFEHKRDPGLREIFPIWVSGFLAKISGSMLFPFLFWDAVAPLLAIILFFIFFMELTASFKMSLLGSLLLFFYFDPGALPTFDSDFFFNLFHAPIHRPIIEMERLPSPQMNFPILILFYLSLIKFYRNQRSIALIVSTGLLSGILVYSYFYYAVLIACLLIGFLGYALAKKNIPLLKGLLGICLLGFLISIPYLIMILKARHGIPINEILERFGNHHGRFLFKRLTLEQIIISVGLLSLIKRKQFKDYLIFSTLIVGTILLNKQLFTGTNLHPMHWYIRILHPFCLISAVNTIHEIIANNTHARFQSAFKKLTLPALGGFCVLLWISAAAQQTDYGRRAKSQFVSSNKEQQVYTLLSKLPESVSILTFNTDISKKVLILTPHDVYLPQFAGTLASDQEIEERLLISFWIMGFSLQDVNQFLAEESAQKNELLRFLLGNKYVFEPRRERQAVYHHSSEKLKAIAQSPQIYIPQNALDEILIRYKSILELPAEQLLNRYKLNLVITDAKKSDFLKPKAILESHFKILSSNAEFLVWERQTA